MRLAECGSRPLQVQRRLLLVLAPGQPLYVARVITSAPAQWDDVVHLAVLAPWGLGWLRLKSSTGFGSRLMRPRLSRGQPSHWIDLRLWGVTLE